MADQYFADVMDEKEYQSLAKRAVEKIANLRTMIAGLENDDAYVQSGRRLLAFIQNLENIYQELF